MRSATARLAAGLLAAALGVGHIGSPDVWFEGAAGPYRVRAVVRMPRTVPGPAEVSVDVRGGTVTAVFVQALDGSTRAGAPPPEGAGRARDGTFQGRLWWMTAGSHAVRVVVEGDKGRGEALVPVTAVDGRRGPVSPLFALFVGAVVAALGAGAVVIASAAAREGDLDHGERARAAPGRARTAGTAAGLAFLAVVAGMGAWWRAADAAFAERAYRPPDLRARWLPGDGLTGLRIEIEPRRRDRPLLEDHGRLVHLFLLRQPDLDAFAHLHPVTRDSVAFDTPLPPLPAGTYRVVAEIVRADGFPQTTSTTIDLPAAPASRTGSLGTDDGWLVTTPDAGSEGRSVAPDGTTFVWLEADRPRTAGEDAGLRFAVYGPGGHPARLQPYMGMQGHAVVARADGKVFVHLHPAGTISAAAAARWREVAGQQRAAAGLALRTTPSADHVVSFPYGFPQSGDYRVFVQVRREGRIVTGTFTARVGSAP